MLLANRYEIQNSYECLRRLLHKYILITFFIVNNPYPCHPYIFITENYFSTFTFFSAPAPKSLAENSIPKKLWIRHCNSAYMNKSLKHLPIIYKNTIRSPILPSTYQCPRIFQPPPSDPHHLFELLLFLLK